MLYNSGANCTFKSKAALPECSTNFEIACNVVSCIVTHMQHLNALT